MSVTVKGMFSYLKERGVIKDHNDEISEPLSHEPVENIRIHQATINKVNNWLEGCSGNGGHSNSNWLRRRKPTREMIDRLSRGRRVREHAPVRGESIRTEIMSASMDSIGEYDSSTASEDGANTSNRKNAVAVQHGLDEDVEMADAGDVEGNQLQRNEGDIQITRPNTSTSMDSIQEYQSNSTDDNDSVEHMEIDEDNENEDEMLQTDENKANRKRKNVLPPCQAWCKKKCTEKISKDQRETINKEYWMLSKEQQRVWLLSHTEATVPKRINPNATNPRKHTYTYSLMSEDDGNVQVCRTFFLTTLGFKSSSNSVITWLFKVIAEQGIGVYAPEDGRGRHGNHVHKLSEEKKKVIKDHIMSHHPCISHYRREHAPNRLYLPPELNVKMMFTDFNDKHPGICKYQTYRKMVRDLNISFARLGKEECEICEHKKNHDVEDCEECINYEAHLQRADIARKRYKHDKEQKLNENEIIVSADMEKVIMLPRMEGIKSCVFTRRLVQFHETFAPIGKRDRATPKPIGVIWNESISGRSASDVASSFIKFLETPNIRDKEKVAIWLDNCGAQNKNWALFTALVAKVNDDNTLKEISLRYLETGHTFMSCDSFHAKVEKEMKRRCKIFDSIDFESVINSCGQAAPMNYSDFSNYENCVSSAAYTNKPTLAKVKEVVFTRAETSIKWKESHEDEEFKSGEFLKRKVIENILNKKQFNKKQKPRGITEDKKQGIIRNLVKLMPETRRAFWNNIPTEAVDDLIVVQ